LQKRKDNLDLKTYVEGRLVPVLWSPEAAICNAQIYSDKVIILGLNRENVNYQEVYKKLDLLYINMAKKFLPKAFEQYLYCFSYEEKPILRIRKMSRQWGNCKSKAKVITLNSHLIKLPSELRSYVVFHELVHLIHPNHSKDFYKIIEHQFPHRLELDKELKKWSFVLRDNYVEEYPSEKSS